MTDKYFIFRCGSKEPEGQIIYGDDCVNGSGKSALNEIFKIKLEGNDAQLTLSELILKFRSKIE